MGKNGSGTCKSGLPWAKPRVRPEPQAGQQGAWQPGPNSWCAGPQRWAVARGGWKLWGGLGRSTCATPAPACTWFFHSCPCRSKMLGEYSPVSGRPGGYLWRRGGRQAPKKGPIRAAAFVSGAKCTISLHLLQELAARLQRPAHMPGGGVSGSPRRGMPGLRAHLARPSG